MLKSALDAERKRTAQLAGEVRRLEAQNSELVSNGLKEKDALIARAVQAEAAAEKAAASAVSAETQLGHYRRDVASQKQEIAALKQQAAIASAELSSSHKVAKRASTPRLFVQRYVAGVTIHAPPPVVRQFRHFALSFPFCSGSQLALHAVYCAGCSVASGHACASCSRSSFAASCAFPAPPPRHTRSRLHDRTLNSITPCSYPCLPTATVAAVAEIAAHWHQCRC